MIHSVIFAYGFNNPGALGASAKTSATAQVTEGVWWKQEKNVTGFLALANTTSQPITAVIDMSDNHATVLGTHKVTISPQGMKTLDLQELQSAPTSEGGIRVSYKGQQDDLLINGGVEDTNSGYSANLPFAPPTRPLPPNSHALTVETISELGLMVGAADPMMRFPVGTTFAPYSVLRNVSSQPISVIPTLWWMASGAPASFQLPQFTVSPLETRTLDLPSLLADAGLRNFNGSVNLALDTQGQLGLLIASGSVDQTNTYVFEVSPRGITKSAGKSISYWSTADGDDTMVTLWNPADEPQDYIFRLEFSGGHYSLPIHLEARATRMFNISDIIMTQVPDADGNIIPAAIQGGSAEIVGSQADNQSILVAIDSGVYNVRRATCYQQCTTCSGATDFWVANSPFDVFVGGQQQEHFMDQWNTGAQYDLTSGSGWSSSNTSMATVQTGMVSGLASGTFTLTAGDSGVPLYANSCSPYNPCPINGGGSGSGTGNVNDPTPNITGVSPPSWDAGATTPVVITGSGFGTSPLLSITDTAGAITQVQVTRSSDTEIDALVTVADNAPLESVTVTVTSRGYNGNGFLSGGGNSPKSNSATVSVNPIVVTLSINNATTGAQPAPDNSARDAYAQNTGTYSLGLFVQKGYCSLGYEIAGKVSPRSYQGNVLLVRSLQGQDWTGLAGQTLLQTFPSGTPDTSKPQYEDQNPFSGGSADVVYDLDAPGVNPDPLLIWRRRVNFYENAQLPDGTYVALELPFFVRLSCLGNNSGNVFSSDVSGDNMLGGGQTKTSWNLQ